MTKEERFRETILARAGGICEICGKAPVQAHHIAGRKVAERKTSGWPEELCEDYPHIPLNGIALCLGGHRWMAKALRHSKPMLFAWLKHAYGKHIYRGKSYSKWMAGPGPWEEYL